MCHVEYCVSQARWKIWNFSYMSVESIIVQTPDIVGGSIRTWYGVEKQAVMCAKYGIILSKDGFWHQLYF